MQTYGQAFHVRCHELAQAVNLDAIRSEDDRAFFFDMFTRYLGMIEEYYAIKMHAERAAHKEKLRLVHGAVDEMQSERIHGDSA